MGPEYETVPFGILDVFQQVLEEKYVSGTRVVTVSRKYVECVHNIHHCVHHTVHELSDDTSTRVLFACCPGRMLDTRDGVPSHRCGCMLLKWSVSGGIPPLLHQDVLEHGGRVGAS